MKISKHAQRNAKELLRACLVEGALDETRARAAVQQVLGTKPRGYLEILTHFQRLVKLALDQRTARVESPVPLTADLQAKVQGDLARAYGPRLEVSFVQNPALIGGLRVKVGSDVYDGSIQARLAVLQESF